MLASVGSTDTHAKIDECASSVTARSMKIVGSRGFKYCALQSADCTGPVIRGQKIEKSKKVIVGVSTAFKKVLVGNPPVGILSIEYDSVP
jgi:hypothetical protein